MGCAHTWLTLSLTPALTLSADSRACCVAALCEDGPEAWTCTRHGRQSAAALAVSAGLKATDARVRAKLAALAGAVAAFAAGRVF